MKANKQSEIRAHFWSILHSCDRLISDYEEIQADIETQKKYPQIENAYIDSLIIYLGKVFSTSNNEAFRLSVFKSICSDSINQEIEQIEQKHKSTIAKIVKNRNKLIAHLDPDFYNLGFSEQEIERMLQKDASAFNWDHSELTSHRDWYMKNLKSTKKNEERYSISDFQTDLPVIKELATQLLDIWNRSRRQV